MRLLLIGSRGFIGAHLVNATRERFDLLSDDGIDITRADKVRDAFEAGRPELVILTAAISDIDRCQREPERADAVNVVGPEVVARECARMGARLIFTSSGAVYDGLQRGYREEDPVSPVSIYGETKARAEKIVASIVPDAVTVRLSLVLGFALRAGTNSLLEKLTDHLRANRSITVPDEHRNPIDVETLCAFLVALAERPGARGVYHLGAADCWSREEIVRAVARRLGVPESLVVRGDAAVPGRAPRGRDHFLISDKIVRECGLAVPTCEEIMERCFHAVAQSHS